MDAIALACFQTTQTESLLVTCLTSRRNEVYAQAWSLGASLQSLSNVEAVSLDAVPDFMDRAGISDVVVAGSGSERFSEAARGTMRRIQQAPESTASNAVHGVSIRAARRFSSGSSDDVSSFEPFYLKDFVAKRGGSPFTAARSR
jgi:tRNA threonylcarbamoyladenosine biosynthesis protein TsaB